MTQRANGCPELSIINASLTINVASTVCRVTICHTRGIILLLLLLLLLGSAVPAGKTLAWHSSYVRIFYFIIDTKTWAYATKIFKTAAGRIPPDKAYK